MKSRVWCGCGVNIVWFKKRAVSEITLKFLLNNREHTKVFHSVGKIEGVNTWLGAENVGWKQ